MESNEVSTRRNEAPKTSSSEWTPPRVQKLAGSAAESAASGSFDASEALS